MITYSQLAIVIMGLLGVMSICYAAIAKDSSLVSAQESSSLGSNGTGTDVPILEKISDKGIYLVQLRWPQVTFDPVSTFSLQTVFLNATAPYGTNVTFPNAETNYTGSGSETGLTVPSTLERILPIDSYDISIYSDDGALLWKKVNQTGAGGMPGHHVVLEGNYTGPVTIEINNIEPGWEVSPESGDMTDSVKFSTSVVPEFSMIALAPLASAIGGVLLTQRLRSPL